MLVWSKKLYIGERAKKNRRKIQRKLTAGKIGPEYYLITRPSNEDNLFDLLPAAELLFPYYQRQELLVYGLAKGRKEAEELLLLMLEDIYRETGALSCKEYFETGKNSSTSIV